MPEAKLYQTKITITGVVDPKLLSDLKKMGAQIKQVAGESVKVGKESKKGFEAMELGAHAAELAVDQLKESMMALVGPLIALGTLVKGVEWGKDEMKEGAEKAAKLREQMILLKGVLEGTDLVSKHGMDVNVLLGKYLEGSERLATEQGDIFGKGFYTAVQTQLAEAGIGYKLSEELTGALTNFAGMKKGTLLGLTSDDVSTYAEMVKRAFTTGQLGRSRMLLGLDANAAKAFNTAYKEGNKLEMERIILSGKYFKSADAFAKEWLKGPEAELQKARTEHTVAQVKASKDWLEVQEKLETSVLNLETAFEPILGSLGTIANDMMPDIQKDFQWVTDNVPIWARNFEQTFRSIKVELEHDGIASAFDQMGREAKKIGDELTEMMPNITIWGAIFTGFTRMILFDLWAIEKALEAVKWALDAIHTITDKNSPANKAFENLTPQQKSDLDDPTNGAGKYGIPHLATGGFVSGRTIAEIGEGGNSEMVTPLKNPNVLDDSLQTQQDTLDTLKDILDKMTGGAGGSGLSGGGSGGSGGGGGAPWKRGHGGSGGAGNNVSGSIDGVQFTHYGYKGDSTPDWNSAHGIGDHENHLTEGLSVALTKSERFALFGYWGKSRGQKFTMAGHQWEDDDTAPESNRRVDVYDKSNTLLAQILQARKAASEAKVTGTGHKDSVGAVLGAQWGASNGAYYGQRSSNNVDAATPGIFKMASGGIVNGKILSWLGEGGRSEKVTPLSKGVGGIHDGGTRHTTMSPVFNITVHGSGGSVAEEIESHLREHFQNYLNYASFEDARRRFR